ncbi:MAG: CPBP family intramembrane metalloprotease [Lachnospiraceae bacterium]|nr:CPBP family intramembrane metalloprotease [Lachnospiraceae bacterium]
MERVTTKQKLSCLIQAVKYALIFIICQVTVTLCLQIYAQGKVDSLGLASNTDEYNSDVSQIVGSLSYVYVILYALLAIGVVLFFIKAEKRSFMYEAGLKKASLKDFLLWFVISVGATAVTLALFNMIPRDISVVSSYVESSKVLFDSPFILKLLGSVVMAPLCEELFFRGLIFNNLKKIMPLFVAAVFSSLIFGVLHGQILWVAYATAFGVFLCFIVHYSRNLAAALVIHALFNLYNIIIDLLKLSVSVKIWMAVLIAGAIILAISLVTMLKGEQNCEGAQERVASEET